MVHYNAKSLGVNPWVETDNGIERLSFIDGDYEKEYLRIAALAQRGWYLITQDLKI
jgi:hypothetical protein